MPGRGALDVVIFLLIHSEVVPTYRGFPRAHRSLFYELFTVVNIHSYQTRRRKASLLRAPIVCMSRIASVTPLTYGPDTLHIFVLAHGLVSAYDK